MVSQPPIRCHEWCKHGTCAVAGLDDVVSMISYFKSALDLFAQADMNTVFQNNGIVSSTTKTYKVSGYCVLAGNTCGFTE